MCVSQLIIQTLHKPCPAQLPLWCGGLCGGEVTGLYVHALTCGVGVVVAFQPGLHAYQVMLVDQEDDILGPIDLTYCKAEKIKQSTNQETPGSVAGHCIHV